MPGVLNVRSTASSPGRPSFASDAAGASLGGARGRSVREVGHRHRREAQLEDDTPFEAREIALPEGERAEAARELLSERLQSVRALADGGDRPDGDRKGDTRPESRQYLFEEACELYLNEMNWEELTDEEKVGDGELTEMVFPGLLAFVDALVPGSGGVGADPSRDHPDVVRDFLLWLAARLQDLRSFRGEEGHERERARREAAITDDLLDLVAGRLYGLSPEQVERVRT